MKIITLLITWFLLFNIAGFGAMMLAFTTDAGVQSKLHENFLLFSILAFVLLALGSAVGAYLGFKKEGHIIAWLLPPIIFMVIDFVILTKFIFK